MRATSRRTPLTTGVAVVSAFAIALLGSVVLPTATPAAVAAPFVGTAVFGPVTAPADQTFSGLGSIGAITVPAGVCAVRVTVLGGAGGSASTSGTGVVVSPGGAGASVSATFAINPGHSISGTVGGGGTQVITGGANGGGAGGAVVDQHPGAGGGGYSSVSIDGLLAVVAGGGGATGGGHPTNGVIGAGGDAGRPTAAGVANGTAGANGQDIPIGTVVGGGSGGSAAGGAGGTNSANAALTGGAGSSLQGGNGVLDPNYDAGGGGGAGYFGGGAGASTVARDDAAGVRVSGAGGGGGSSYIAPSLALSNGSVTPQSIASAAGARRTTAGTGANGSIVLDWVECAYDLSVTKTADVVNTTVGSVVRWTVTVANVGSTPMTQGDTVTLTDSLPGAGTKTVVSVTPVIGTNPQLASGPVTCNTTVGSAMPATIDCSRPYQPIGSPVSGVRGIDPGESITIVYDQTITAADLGALSNTATVTDRTSGDTNDTVTRTVNVVDAPTADNNSSLDNTIGSAVAQTVLVNDNAGSAALVPATLTLWDPVANAAISSPYVVAGQGTWTVTSSTVAGSTITFTPLASFKGNPTPVTYRVSDANDLSDTATVTVTYLASAVDDESLGNVLGSTVDQSVLANDNGAFTTSTLTITGETSPGVKLVPGVGTWSVQSGGVIRFVPLITFLGDPPPIDYTVQTTDGATVGAQVLVTYLQTAADDESLGNALGSTVNQSVLANDRGIFTESSLTITGQTAPGVKVVAGEGTWSVQPGGVIRFVPLSTFFGDPTPIAYTVQTVDAETVGANVLVTYVQTAADDEDLNNVIGTTVNQSVLINDRGVFDVSTLAITGSTAGELVVAGQGTWSVQPGGVIRFVPLSTFLGDPTPIAYTVDTVDGETVGADVRVTYVQSAVDDEDLDNVLGSTVDQAVLVNDLGVFTAATLAITGATAGELVVAGQGTWSVQPGGIIRFVPLSTFLGNPTPIAYTVDTVDGETVGADVRVTYVQSAVNDEDLDNVLGSTVDQTVLTNDLGTFTASTLSIVDETAPGVKVVAGEGTWSVQPGGVIRFVPLSTFKGDPTVIRYEVDTTSGATVSAQVLVTYVQVAVDDEDLNNVLGSTVDQSVLVNDEGVFVASTLRIVSETAPGVKVVAGQGTWSVQPGGVIRFVPLATFFGEPTPIEYRVDTVDGDTVGATVLVTYVQVAEDDEDLNNALGSPVDQTVLTNDKGIFDVATLEITGATAGVLTVAGEGTWSVEAGGIIRFTPLAAFLGDPAPISYTVETVDGDSVGADVRVTYVQSAVDDEDLNNVLGSTVDQSVLVNDLGVFDVATLRIYGATAGELVVPGEGTWSVRAGGVIRFVPLSTFLGNPTPISYSVDTVDGETVAADVIVTYVQSAVDDEDLNNVIGTTVDQTVLVNDLGIFDEATLTIVGGTAGELVVAGEGTWTVQPGGVIRFVPLPTFLGDPAPISYEVETVDGDVVGADVLVTYVQSAVNDADLDNVLGSTVDQSVLVNDRGVFDASTLEIVGATAGELVVAGEGTWSVQPGGVIRFVPLVTFLGDPAPISYEVETVDGELLTATVTVTYLQVAVDDSNLLNPIGSTVNTTVVANDRGIWDLTTVTIVGETAPGVKVVPGEGTWSVQANGVLRFEPLSTFLVDPTPIRYTVDTVDGDTAEAGLVVTYVPDAVDDVVNGAKLGDTIPLDVLTNDLGDMDATSVRIIDPATNLPVATLVVTGQGTWTVNTTTGVISFDPEPGFVGNPTPIGYEVTDSTGDTVSATVTISYTPEASNDSSTGNIEGRPVTVDVIGNDLGNLDPTSVRIVDPNGGALVTTLVVPGEGTWTVNSTTGAITFTPAPGFTGDPTTITYQVSDMAGAVTTAQITITYVHPTAGLVVTGADLVPALSIALLLLLIGALAMVISRRRLAND